jgi:hypothetical protein
LRGSPAHWPWIMAVQRSCIFLSRSSEGAGYP